MFQFSANLSTLFTELPLRERFAAAREAGFKAVEVQSPYELAAEEAAEILTATGLQLVLMNAPGGDREAGDIGLTSIPGREEAFEAGLDAALTYAIAVGRPMVHVLAGAPVGIERAEAEATFARNMSHAIRRATKAGVRLNLEVLNPVDAPGYFLRSTSEAAGAAVAHGAGLQFDVYHAAMMNEDAAALLRSFSSSISHIQIADAPGRGEPGTGKIDWAAIFAAVGEIAYDGHIGCEYRPEHATWRSLHWAKRYLQDQTP